VSEHFDGESPAGSFDAALTVPDAPARGASSPGLLARIAKARLIEALPQLAVGRLTIHLPDGATHQGGDPDSALHATMWIDDEAFFGAFAARGDIGVGESWMAGHFRTDDLVRALSRVGNKNASGEYYITDVFELLRNDGRTVAAVDAVPPEDVLSVNDPVQLAEVDAILRRRHAMPAGGAR
jgi:sugar phosphate isomerase/epimerase